MYGVVSVELHIERESDFEELVELYLFVTLPFHGPVLGLHDGFAVSIQCQRRFSC